MLSRFAIPLSIFLLMFTVVNSAPQETNKFLIDEQTSLQIHHEIDSLYLAGDYSRAIDQTLILMAYYKEKENTGGQILCCNYMGDFLRASGSRTSSLEYLYQALALNALLHDSILLAQTYTYIGATYFELDYPAYLGSAQVYASLSMDIASRIHDDKLIYSDLNILGKVQEGKGNLDSALLYMTRAHGIVRKVNPVDEALILCNMAGAYFLKGDLERSKELAKEAYNYAKRDNVNTYLRLTTTLLERIYLQEGNFWEAHNYLSELTNYTRNFLDEKTEERVTTMMEQIRLAQEEAAIQKELDRRRLWTIFMVIFAVGALVFLFIFAVQKTRLRKTNKELLVMNQEIRFQQQETETLARKLETSNGTLKKFISIIAHDLKNPFNTIIGFSDLLNTEFDSLSPEERKLAIENTHKSALSAFSLLEKLLSWARMQTGAFQMEVTPVEISGLIDEVVNLVQPSAFLKKQNLITDVPSNIKINADRNMMLAVFRNILSNAIKFTPREGTIKVSATFKGENVKLVVRDSGVGIPESELGKLFNIDEQYKTTGTSGEKGTGLGLLLCREYLEKNNGTIQVESEPGKGTAFTVILPVAAS